MDNVGTNIIQISDAARKPLQCSTSPMITQCEARLKPIGRKDGIDHLVACLRQIAPHLSASDCAEWAGIAAISLKGIPADLMIRGAQLAREKCEFPGGIVPSIMADAKPSWERRKRALAEELALQANRDAPRLAKPDYVTPDEAKSIIAQTLAGFGQ